LSIQAHVRARRAVATTRAAVAGSGGGARCPGPGRAPLRADAVPCRPPPLPGLHGRGNLDRLGIQTELLRPEPEVFASFCQNQGEEGYQNRLSDTNAKLPTGPNNKDCRYLLLLQMKQTPSHATFVFFLLNQCGNHLTGRANDH
jgi:hypothetical protein